ncbi:Afg3-Like Protein 2 [Manis pentadactyla]|nr:Afg3-Like Protein 2 [Manis pentadactyla]
MLYHCPGGGRTTRTGVTVLGAARQIVQFGVSEKLGQVSFDFPPHLVSFAHAQILALTAVLGAGGQGGQTPAGERGAEEG